MAKLSSELAPHQEALIALSRLLARLGNRGVIIGGIAVSLRSKPRFTGDIDAVFTIEMSELPNLIESAKQLGMEPRRPDALAFARSNHVLLLKHVSSQTPVDISIGMLPFEYEMVDRASEEKFGSLSLRIPTPEDLIILKAVAHRPKDLIDIRAIINANLDLDKERIRYWVQQFAEVMEMPEIWGDISKWL